ncbi:MAG: AIR synthase-related protein, partial [Acidobacteria bacterium]|nr:AIR synthase-related protein [Acidobacteriota bacterium]
GTGTLFAAEMRLKAKGRWIAAAITSMLQSNQQAGECLRRYQATACTDVTGFGLLGHLVEMTKASMVDARLFLRAVPLLDGALETVRARIFSSLQPQNLRLRRAVRDLDRVSKDPVYPLIFDPQTAGGLLASVPAARADQCLAELRDLGYAQAAIVGVVESRGEFPEPIEAEP